MQLKQKCVPAIAKAGTTEIDEDKLFIQFFSSCMQGLLSGNARYDDDALAVQELYRPEELLDQAEDLADLMVEVIRNRWEARKFAEKL